MSPIFFTVTLRAKHGDYRGLKSLLKRAWRDHRMRAVEIQQRSAAARRRRSDATQVRWQRGEKIMDMSKYAGSAFLSLDDVQDGSIRGEIADVEEGNYDKPVLTFTNGLKFSLNATNTAALIKEWGKESDEWIGERVELYAGEAKYQGKMTPSVLARALKREPGDKKKKPKPKPAAASVKAAQHDDMNDEIPY